MLKDANETDNANNSKGKYGELLRQLIHVVLERGPPLLDILHHAKNNTKFGLGPSSDGDPRTATCTL